MTMVSFLLCMTLFVGSDARGNKRILVHSSEDVAHLITTLESKVSALEAEVTALKAVKSAVGATYIRWGRTTCPGNGTEFIYKGYMVGNKYNQYGGGANSLCLPDDPTWNVYVDGYNGGATVYGTEIEIDDSRSTKLFGKQANNQDIPCAVCRSTRGSHVMMPARANCYSGWTQEYAGYLVASYAGWQASSDYVCLDAGLEFVFHGSGSDDEHVVNVVEVRCGTVGSLPCPPFTDGRELACVVCTK